ncbi:hypothetical protein AB0876_32300 [Mycobacterium sp. NPDC049093]
MVNRTRRATFAVTPEEQAFLQDEARRHGVPLAKYLRRETLRWFWIEQQLREAQEHLAAAQRAADEAKNRSQRTRASFARTGHGRFHTSVEAETWLRNFTQARPDEPLKTLLRRAYHRAHPDKGGSREDWEKVDQSRRLILGSR